MKKFTIALIAISTLGACSGEGPHALWVTAKQDGAVIKSNAGTFANYDECSRYGFLAVSIVMNNHPRASVTFKCESLS